MDTKNHILDTAENLFNRQGYTSVGVDLIRDKASVSKTTIYRHFTDKSGLIIATLNRKHRFINESIHQKLTQTEGLEEKLLALMEWHYEWFASKDFAGCMFMHALAEFKEQDKAICQVAIEHKRWTKKLIRSIFSGSQKESRSARDTKVNLIINIFDGLIINTEFFGTPLSKPIFKNILLQTARSEIITPNTHCN